MDAGEFKAGHVAGDDTTIPDSQTHLRQLFDLSQSQTVSPVPVPGRAAAAGRSRLTWRGSVCSLPLAREGAGRLPSPSDSAGSAQRLPFSAGVPGASQHRPAASVSPSVRPAPSVLASAGDGPAVAKAPAGLGFRLKGGVTSRPVKRATGGSWLPDCGLETVDRVSPPVAQPLSAAADLPERRCRSRSPGSDVTEGFLFRPAGGGAVGSRRPEDEAPRLNLSDGFSFEEDSPPAASAAGEGTKPTPEPGRHSEQIPPAPTAYKVRRRADLPPAGNVSTALPEGRPERHLCGSDHHNLEHCSR